MTEEKKDIQVASNNKIIVKKQPGYRKFFKSIVQEDGETIKDYILMDIVVPAIKRGIIDTIDMMLNGNGRRNSYDRNSGRVSYRSYYSDRDRGTKVISAGGYDYNEIIFPTRSMAEMVRDDMDAYMEQYPIMSVMDYYDIIREAAKRFRIEVNIPTSYTDNDYGWTDVSKAPIVRVGDGWAIRLPRALPIN